MKPTLKIKIAVDAAMSVSMLLLMAYGLVGEAAHEWIGMGMFALSVAHHVLNRRWIQAVPRGRYTPLRIVQTALAGLIFLCMVGSMISGIVLSRHVFAFLPRHGGYELAQQVHKADGSKYKDFYYYGCKHRAMTRGHKCDFKKQINEELLDSAVAEVIVKLVSNPKFAAMMQEKISMKVDTSAIEQEIAAHEKQLRQSYSVKVRLMDEIDSLDPDDKHYIKRKADLDDRLYKMYDKIEDTENQLVAARAKKMAIEAEKLTGDNIYKVLIFFDKLYSVMDDQEKRQLMESLLSEVQIYEERQPNGQWLKSIKFKLPIIAEDMSLSLDNDTHIETVCLLVK